MSDLGEWNDHIGEGEPDNHAGEGEPDEPSLYFGSVDDFVREFVCQVFRRQIAGNRGPLRWSARWWESAEAILRLEALWRSWEELRQDPATGMSVWLRDHADVQLGVLMSSTGPWQNSEDSAEIYEPLPYEPPPAGMFPDVRQDSK